MLGCQGWILLSLLPQLPSWRRMQQREPWCQQVLHIAARVMPLSLLPQLLFERCMQQRAPWC